MRRLVYIAALALMAMLVLAPGAVVTRGVRACCGQADAPKHLIGKRRRLHSKHLRL
jgi:hypothetical protein